MPHNTPSEAEQEVLGVLIAQAQLLSRSEDAALSAAAKRWEARLRAELAELVAPAEADRCGGSTRSESGGSLPG